MDGKKTKSLIGGGVGGGGGVSGGGGWNKNFLGGKISKNWLFFLSFLLGKAYILKNCTQIWRHSPLIWENKFDQRIQKMSINMIFNVCTYYDHRQTWTN